MLVSQGLSCPSSTAAVRLSILTGNAFQALTLPIVPLYIEMKGKPLSQKCVARTEKNNPDLVLWTHAMTAFKRHEVDRCPTGKGENVGDGLRGKASDGDSRC